MEFCFYCSRFPTPGQAWGCTPGNSRLGAAAYAALAGGVGARPRRGISGLCWKRQVLLVPGGYTPGNSRLGSWSPVGTVQDRPRRQPRRRLTPRLRERLARVRAGGGGCTLGNSRPGSWSPVGTVQDRPRRQPRRRLNAALAGEASARPRRGVAPRAIRACGPGPRWGPFRTDRGGSRDGGLTPRLCKALAHVRAMGFGGRPPPGISPSLH